MRGRRRVRRRLERVQRSREKERSNSRILKLEEEKDGHLVGWSQHTHTTRQGIFVKGNTKAEVFVFLLLICFSVAMFTLTSEITESSTEMPGGMLNAVCLCHPGLYEGVSVFYLKPYVSLGFIL